jgi:hypothetical protein
MTSHPESLPKGFPSLPFVAARRTEGFNRLSNIIRIDILKSKGYLWLLRWISLLFSMIESNPKKILREQSMGAALRMTNAVYRPVPAPFDRLRERGQPSRTPRQARGAKSPRPGPKGPGRSPPAYAGSINYIFLIIEDL